MARLSSFLVTYYIIINRRNALHNIIQKVRGLHWN